MAKKFRHKHLSPLHRSPSFIALLFGHTATAAGCKSFLFYFFLFLFFPFSKMFFGSKAITEMKKTRAHSTGEAVKACTRKHGRAVGMLLAFHACW
jgi:hypothetical protein